MRQRDRLTRYTYAHHPFDVVGWDGGLYPYALSIHDFEPIVGALHQPPPVHQTFEAPNIVVCSFVPRLYDFHPGAIKVPYHHANVDSDEVLFYSAGDFMSRAGSGIGVGSISLHPAGFIHGPQPGSLEAARPKERTEEVAVMLDTFRPLLVSDDAAGDLRSELPLDVGRRGRQVIAARHLTKRFGSRVAVDDLSFDVAPGVVTGFLGPNGSGKSHDDAAAAPARPPPTAGAPRSTAAPTASSTSR